MLNASVNTQLLGTDTNIAYSQTSNSAYLDKIKMVDVTAVIAANNPAAVTATDTDVNTTNDTIAITAGHGFTTGVKVALTSSGTLPAGLSATNYYMIVVSSTLLKFATSQANAAAGTAVDITDAGTAAATITLTPATTLAGTIKLQKNNNPPHLSAVWVDLDDTEIDNGNNSLTISAAGNKNWAIWNAGFRELRASVAVTSGTLTADIRLHGKA